MMGRMTIMAGALSLATAWTGTAAAQTEAQCLQGFAVKPDRSVSYLFIDPTGQRKVSVNTLTCVDAERFRERLYIQMDKKVYDSEQSLRGRLADARATLTKLNADLTTANDEARTRALVASGSVTITSLSAIVLTASCASAVVDGAGAAACGPAVAGSYQAFKEWYELVSGARTWTATKSAAQTVIQNQLAQANTLSQQLDAAKAKNIRENYSTLFVSICRAVQQQCL